MENSNNEALYKGAIKAIMKMTDFISRFILCNTSMRYKFVSFISCIIKHG